MKNGTIIAVFGEPIEIIASSSTTNYAFVIGLQTSPPGAGPPPHRHLGEDEVLTVIDGEFDFFDGESWGPSTEAKLSIPFAVAITVSGPPVNRRGGMMFHNKWRRVGRVLRRDFFASIAGRHGKSSKDQQLLSAPVPYAEKMTTSSRS